MGRRRCVCEAATLAILLAMTAATAAGQQNLITPRLKQGGVLNLEVKKARKQSAPNRPSGASSTPVTVTVLETGASGSVLDWVPGDTKFDNPAMADDPIVRATMDSVRGLHLEAMLNADGEYQGLRNQVDVQARLKRALGIMREKIALELPESQRARFRAMARQIFQPEVLLQSVARDVNLFFGLSGVAAEPGKTLRVPMQVPNPLGGQGTLKSTVVVSVRSVNKAAGEARVEVRQDYDADAMKVLLDQVMAMAGPKAPPAGAMPEMKLTDVADYVVDLANGWPRRVHHRRTITSGGEVAREDTTEITVVATR